jgi:sensor domain CHASE-containing protein
VVRKKARADQSEVLAMMMLASKEAAQAAPYVHPKLAAAVHRIASDDTKRDTESIRRELAELDPAAAAAERSSIVADDSELQGLRAL